MVRLRFWRSEECGVPQNSSIFTKCVKKISEDWRCFESRLTSVFLKQVLIIHFKTLAQSAGAVEYTDYFSAEGCESPHECPVYDIKQSDGEVPVMLELSGMQSTPSLASLPGTLWPGVVAPDGVLAMGQIELNWLLWALKLHWNLC